MVKKVALVLSGCGCFDGTEISEAVLTLLALSKYRANVSMFAPSMKQLEVVNYVTKEPVLETRNILVEAARIARGNIAALSSLQAHDYHAIILPGGLGITKNLSNIGDQGANAKIIPQLHDLLYTFLNTGKPLGAICIAPALLGVVAKNKFKLKMTLGSHHPLLDDLQMEQQECKSDDVVVDEQYKVVTTPAFMHSNALLIEVYTGIEKLVNKILHMI